MGHPASMSQVVHRMRKDPKASARLRNARLSPAFPRERRAPARREFELVTPPPFFSQPGVIPAQCIRSFERLFDQLRLLPREKGLKPIDSQRFFGLRRGSPLSPWNWRPSCLKSGDPRRSPKSSFTITRRVTRCVAMLPGKLSKI